MIAPNTEYQNSLFIERSLEIAAPLNLAYEALLEMLGSGMEVHDGTPMPMVFEPRVGGRWFRDKGDDTGHLWGFVQVIKPPTLIEIYGPLFMSCPAISHVQYRLIANGEGTLLQFCHRATGELDPQICENVKTGWEHQIDVLKKLAESKSGMTK